MKIDKEGYPIIRNCCLAYVAVVGLLYFLNQGSVANILAAIFLLYILFLLRFFRLPKRALLTDDKKLFSPADGKIVALERVYEDEYFKEERIQVSIFMSIWNVHANWYPIAGEVKYFRHHHGDFMVANHPKSSTHNERTTVVVQGEGGDVLMRQIAGYVARRIVSYAKEGDIVTQNSRLGFIKFGSRVDLFLPLDSDINVKLGDRVVGSQTIIANFKNKYD